MGPNYRTFRSPMRFRSHKSACSTMGSSPRAAVPAESVPAWALHRLQFPSGCFQMFHHGSLHRPQGNLLLGLEYLLPSFFTALGLCGAGSHIFSLVFSAQCFLDFLKYVLTEEEPMSLVGSDLVSSLLEPTGTVSTVVEGLLQIHQ